MHPSQCASIQPTNGVTHKAAKYLPRENFLSLTLPRRFKSCLGPRTAHCEAGPRGTLIALWPRHPTLEPRAFEDAGREGYLLRRLSIDATVVLDCAGGTSER